MAIVRSTIELAHSLGLRMVAEGVEDEGTADQLSEAGCDLEQGWYYAKAMPADQFEIVAGRSRRERAGPRPTAFGARGDVMTGGARREPADAPGDGLRPEVVTGRSALAVAAAARSTTSPWRSARR